MTRFITAAICAALITAAAPAAAKVGSCNDPIVWGTTVSSTGPQSTFGERWAEMNEIFADEVNIVRVNIDGRRETLLFTGHDVMKTLP